MNAGLAISQARSSPFRRILRVGLGNALEMYDFQIFGYYAPAIAATFFPNTSASTSLLLSLATFGAGRSEERRVGKECRL